MAGNVVRDKWDNVCVVTREAGADSHWDGRVKNQVYNYQTLEWEAQTPSAVGTGGGGDASAANQLLGNASLASIDTKLSSTATAQAVVQEHLLKE